MLKHTNYNIVFQEVPNEVTLSVSISNCPNRCKGCHSPHLWEDNGEALDNEVITALLAKYKNAVTCVCFMGGDANPDEVEQLAVFVKKLTDNQLKVAWYSGKKNFPAACSLHNFDYVKLGPYIEKFGGLDSPNTNQRFYKIANGKMVDMTSVFVMEKSKNIL